MSKSSKRRNSTSTSSKPSRARSRDPLPLQPPLDVSPETSPIPDELTLLVEAGGANDDAQPISDSTMPDALISSPTSIPKRSALDAAALVLAETAAPMRVVAMIETMTAKGYWTSPGGKTPAATLSAALRREIATKGPTSRFRLDGKGLFTRNQPAEISPEAVAVTADESTSG